VNYECESCGSGFETLSAKRLHQRECSEAAAEIDADGMDVDEMADLGTRELLVCDVCDQLNDGASRIDRDITDAGVGVTLRFECSACGAWNKNTAVLGGERV